MSSNQAATSRILNAPFWGFSLFGGTVGSIVTVAMGVSPLSEAHEVPSTAVVGPESVGGSIVVQPAYGSRIGLVDANAPAHELVGAVIGGSIRVGYQQQELVKHLQQLG